MAEEMVEKKTYTRTRYCITKDLKKTDINYKKSEAFFYKNMNKNDNKIIIKLYYLGLDGAGFQKEMNNEGQNTYAIQEGNIKYKIDSGDFQTKSLNEDISLNDDFNEIRIIYDTSSTYTNLYKTFVNYSYFNKNNITLENGIITLNANYDFDGEEFYISPDGDSFTVRKICKNNQIDLTDEEFSEKVEVRFYGNDVFNPFLIDLFGTNILSDSDEDFDEIKEDDVDE